MVLVVRILGLWVAGCFSFGVLICVLFVGLL